eukprot:SM000311S11917  [mRNA]  locus=s311:28613:30768:+ [translate_table: standard]
MEVGLAAAGLAAVIGALLLVIALCFLSWNPRPKPRAVALDPNKWQKFELTHKVVVSHNVRKFRFALPTPATVLGLPIGQHIWVQGFDDKGEEFSRPYTPTTLDSDVGYFELVIKVYAAGVMSQYMDKLSIGDLAAFKGPKVCVYSAITCESSCFACPPIGPDRLQQPRLWLRQGRFKYAPNMVRELGMIAGGTGLTPMYQVARAVLENQHDKTRIRLIYANVTVEDILLKDELDAMVKMHPDRISVHYVLNKPPIGWTGGAGYITKEMIEKHCPTPAPDVMVLRCGPLPMNKAMAAHCEAIGHAKDRLFMF